MSVVLTSCDKTTTTTTTTPTLVDSINNTTWVSTSVALAPGAELVLGSIALTLPIMDTFTLTTLNSNTVLFTPKTLGKRSFPLTLGNFIDTFTVNTIPTMSNVKYFTVTDFVANNLFKDSTLFFFYDSTTTKANGFSGGLYDSLSGLTDSLGIALYLKWTGTAFPTATGAQKNYFMTYVNNKSIVLLAPFTISLKVYKNKLKSPLESFAKYQLLAKLFATIFPANPVLANQVGGTNLAIPDASYGVSFTKQ